MAGKSPRTDEAPLICFPLLAALAHRSGAEGWIVPALVRGAADPAFMD